MTNPNYYSKVLNKKVLELIHWVFIKQREPSSTPS